MTPAVGLHPGVSYSDYAKWEAINHSTLKHFHRSCAHAKQEMDKPRELTDALIEGQALHVATFEPARFSEEFAVMPELSFGSKAEKELAAAIISEFIGKPISGGGSLKKKQLMALAQSGPKTLLTAEQYEEHIGMGKAIRESRSACEFIDAPGLCEVAFVWKDSVTGLLRKGRADKLASPVHPRFKGKKVIVELKSCQDAREFQFGKDAEKFFYDAQGGSYIEGIKLATGEDVLHIIVAVEKNAPHCVGVGPLPAEAMQRGLYLSRKWMDRYADCVATDVFPGYLDKIRAFKWPAWAQQIEE